MDTAENLRDRKTAKKNTAGTAPAAGSTLSRTMRPERLVNCVMRNCVIEDTRVWESICTLYAGRTSGANHPCIETASPAARTRHRPA